MSRVYNNPNQKPSVHEEHAMPEKERNEIYLTCMGVWEQLPHNLRNEARRESTGQEGGERELLLPRV